LNINYCIHRYGEWTMLMLGESVLSLLIVSQTQDMGYFKTFMCGIITIILLQYLHFQSQPLDPDRHALRRNKNAAVLFTHVYQLYSVSLLLLGASYKMFLYEFVYASGTTSHRPMFSAIHQAESRFLAGSAATTALELPVNERQQNIAYFFSGSMALIWFCLDVSSLAHVGINKNLERLASVTASSRMVLVLLIIARISLIVFIATVSQYEHRPEVLALIGMFSVIAQLIIRSIGALALPPEEDEEDRCIETLEAYAAAATQEMQISKKSTPPKGSPNKKWSATAAKFVETAAGILEIDSSPKSSPIKNWSATAAKFVETESAYGSVREEESSVGFQSAKFREGSISGSTAYASSARRMNREGSLTSDFVSARGEGSLVDYHSTRGGSITGSTYGSVRRFRDGSVSSFHSARGGNSLADFASARGEGSIPDFASAQEGSLIDIGDLKDAHGEALDIPEGSVAESSFASAEFHNESVTDSMYGSTEFRVEPAHP